ncbi:hypothetical protein, partial [Devosia sp. MC521]|uniref:hypothetical protein n=1 Tax=Devosia sp. MC521 TaxID=2759954 RepID=UPI001AEE5AC7
TGKRRQWAPPIAKRRAKSAQTRKSDDHNRSRRLSEPVLAGLQMSKTWVKNSYLLLLQGGPTSNSALYSTAL